MTKVGFVQRHRLPLALSAGVVIAALLDLGVVFHKRVAWGDVPTWASAIVATGALTAAGLALQRQEEQVTLVTERLESVGTALASLGEQVDIQQRQLAEQQQFNQTQAEELRQLAADRNREADHRRRRQASRVFLRTVRHPESKSKKAWVGVAALNGSKEPVYDVVLDWYVGAGGYAKVTLRSPCYPVTDGSC